VHPDSEPKCVEKRAKYLIINLESFYVQVIELTWH